MLIKGFSIFISCGHFDEGMGAILAISVVGHPRNIIEIILKLNNWPTRRCRLKTFFCYKLWWPFCSVEQNHCCTFGKGSSKKHFYEIILKLSHWSRRRYHLFFFLS